MRTAASCIVSVVLAGALFAPRAEAQVTVQAPNPRHNVFDDNDGEPPVVTNLARPFTGNVELSLMFTTTLIEKYINHIGGVVGLGYHFNNVLELEAIGGYEFMREASIIGGDSGVRARIGGTREPRLPGLLGMSWLALANLNISPVYGKVNLFSEVDFNSQIYFILGVGATGVVKRQLVDPGNPDAATVTEPVNLGVRAAFDAGVGIRLFITRFMAIRAEFRDIVYWDNADILGNGTTEVDFINNFMGFFGLSFIVN